MGEAETGHLAERQRTSGTMPEERAIRVAIACSVLGTGTKLVAGIVTGSMSMLSSAIDSMGDLLVSIANLFVVRYGDQPADEDHNYGHAKIEGFGAMFEGGFIFAGGIFIIYEAIHKALIGEAAHDPTLGIVVMLPVLAVTAATVAYLRKIARQTGSLVVKSDAVHYATDVWVNVGVLVSLVLTKLLGLAIIDTVISAGIALFMLYSAFGVVREGFDVLMDKSLERAVVDRIVALLHSCDAIHSFHDFRTRRGRAPHVEFHVVVRPEMTTKEVHELFLHMRHRIREVAGAPTRVIVHAHPPVPADECR
jgi:ferrous-iron efflux pump FieF